MMHFDLFGIDIFCLRNKFLAYNLVQRNLKLKYRKSYLGIIWTMLVPAASALVFYFVFKFVMRVKMEHYLVFVLSGISAWTFFVTTLSQGMESVVMNTDLLNKIPMPALAFPLTEAVTAMINFLFSIPVLIAVALLTGVHLGFGFLASPLYWLILFLQGYSLALLLSVVFVYFRDFRHILAILLQVWFYLTPVLYPAEMVPEQFRFLLSLNPVAFVFEGIQQAVVESHILEPTKLAIILAWTCGLGLIATLVYRKFIPTLVERL